MALIKEKINQAGQKASYWKLAVINPNFIQNQASVTLFGFESEVAKEAGDPYILAEGLGLSGSGFEAIFAGGGDIRAKAYLFIKTLPEWQGAVDA